jgi:hypothetical protein
MAVSGQGSPQAQTLSRQTQGRQLMTTLTRSASRLLVLLPPATWETVCWANGHIGHNQCSQKDPWAYWDSQEHLWTYQSSRGTPGLAY